MGAGNSTAVSCSSLDDSQQAKALKCRHYQRRNQQAKMGSQQKYSSNNNSKLLLMRQKHLSSSHFDLNQAHPFATSSGIRFDLNQPEVYSLSNANIGLARPIKVLPARPQAGGSSGREVPRLGFAGKPGPNLQVQQQQQRQSQLRKFSDSLPMLNAEQLVNLQPKQINPVGHPNHLRGPRQSEAYCQGQQQLSRASAKAYSSSSKKPAAQSSNRYYANNNQKQQRQLAPSHYGWQQPVAGIEFGAQGDQLMAQNGPHLLKRATSLSSLHISHCKQLQQEEGAAQCASDRNFCDIGKIQARPAPLAKKLFKHNQNGPQHQNGPSSSRANKYKLKQQQQQQNVQAQGCPVLPPLPRSQSLHELIQLRATENGQRMRTTGTLRGPLGSGAEHSPASKVNLVVELLENKRQEKLTLQTNSSDSSQEVNNHTISSQCSTDEGIHDVRLASNQNSSPNLSPQLAAGKKSALGGLFQKKTSSRAQNSSSDNRFQSKQQSNANLMKRSQSHSALNELELLESGQPDAAGNESQEDLNELTKFLFQFKQRQEIAAQKLHLSQNLKASQTSEDEEKRLDGSGGDASKLQQSPNSTTSSSGFASSSCQSNSIRSSSNSSGEFNQLVESPRVRRSSKKYPAPPIPGTSAPSTAAATTFAVSNKSLISGKLKLSSSLLSIVDEYANNSTLNLQQQQQQRKLPASSADGESPDGRWPPSGFEREDRLSIDSRQLEQLERYTRLRQLSQSELVLNHLASCSSLASNLSPNLMAKSGGRPNGNGREQRPYKSKLLSLIKRISSDKSEAIDGLNGGSDNLMNIKAGSAVGGQLQLKSAPKTRKLDGHYRASNQKLPDCHYVDQKAASFQSERVKPINQDESEIGSSQVSSYSNEPSAGGKAAAAMAAATTESKATGLQAALNSSMGNNNSNLEFDAERQRLWRLKAGAANKLKASESLYDLNFDCDFEPIKNCGIPTNEPATGGNKGNQNKHLNKLPNKRPEFERKVELANGKAQQASGWLQAPIKATSKLIGEGKRFRSQDEGGSKQAACRDNGNWKFACSVAEGERVSARKQSAAGQRRPSDAIGADLVRNCTHKTQTDSAPTRPTNSEMDKSSEQICSEANRLLDDLDHSLNLVSDQRRPTHSDDPWQCNMVAGRRRGVSGSLSRQTTGGNPLASRSSSDFGDGDDEPDLNGPDYATINQAMLDATFGCSLEPALQQRANEKPNSLSTHSFAFGDQSCDGETSSPKWRCSNGKLPARDMIRAEGDRNSRANKLDSKQPFIGKSSMPGPGDDRDMMEIERTNSRNGPTIQGQRGESSKAEEKLLAAPTAKGRFDCAGEESNNAVVELKCFRCKARKFNGENCAIESTNGRIKGIEDNLSQSRCTSKPSKPGEFAKLGNNGRRIVSSPYDSPSRGVGVETIACELANGICPKGGQVCSSERRSLDAENQCCCGCGERDSNSNLNSRQSNETFCSRPDAASNHLSAGRGQLQARERQTAMTLSAHEATGNGDANDRLLSVGNCKLESSCRLLASPISISTSKSSFASSQGCACDFEPTGVSSGTDGLVATGNCLLKRADLVEPNAAGNKAKEGKLVAPSKANCHQHHSSSAPAQNKGKLNSNCPKYAQASGCCNEDVKLQPCVNLDLKGQNLILNIKTKSGQENCSQGKLLFSSQLESQVKSGKVKPDNAAGKVGGDNNFENCCPVSSKNSMHLVNCRSPLACFGSNGKNCPQNVAALSANQIFRSNSELFPNNNQLKQFGKLRNSLFEQERRRKKCNNLKLTKNEPKLLSSSAKLAASSSQLHLLGRDSGNAFRAAVGEKSFLNLLRPTGNNNNNHRSEFIPCNLSSVANDTTNKLAAYNSVDFDDNFILKRKTPNAGLNLKSRC